MELYGNIKCVTYKELTGGENPILNLDKYKNDLKRKKLFVVRKGGGKDRGVLIDYDRLPLDIRKEYDTRNPNATQKIINQFSSKMIQYDSKATDFFHRYETKSGGLTDVKQAEYVLNAEVLNEMRRVENQTRGVQAKCGRSLPATVWKIVMNTCEELREQFKHTLPRSESRLRKIFNSYKKTGYVALVSGKVGNQNTRKIGTKEARLLLKLRRSQFPVYTESQIFDEFNRRALEKGLKAIKSPTSIANYLHSPKVKVLWFAAVFGELEFKKKYSAQIKTRLPELRDALWYADGTKLNLYYRDEKNNMCTTSVYEVMDAFSEVFLGYDIAPHERFDNQYRAFRMAIDTAGVRPYEIVTDNQGGHKKLVAEGFFKKLCRLYRTTMPYNGQSKTIESAFGRFQQQILHKIWHFTGQNMTATKKISRVNIELIEANKDKLPTLEEVKALYAECRAEWNNSVHPDTGLPRMEMYHESENPYTTPVTELDKIQMFWLKTQKPITYTSAGIRMQLNNVEYEYDVYDENGVRDDEFAYPNIDNKFYIMYDPMDFTLVELWEPQANGISFVTQATPRRSVARDTQERTHEENIRLRAQLEKNKQSRVAMQCKQEDFDFDESIAIELLGLNRPRPKGLSKKALAEYQAAYDAGEIKAPVNFPGEPDREEESTYEYEEPQTVGSYEKAVSNMTYGDMYGRF